MSFGAGGEAGLLVFEEGGELGFIWGLNAQDAGLDTFSSTSEGYSVSPRLFSLGLTYALGVWKLAPEGHPGRSIGLSVGASLKLADVGMTLWFSCNSGDGAIVINPDGAACALREDSVFLGVTLDAGIGAALAFPSPGSIGLTRTETCVQADIGTGDVVVCE